MSIRQISVFLENKPGTLNAMTEVLAAASIDLRALSLAETTDFGIARLIVDDVYETATVLKDAGYVCSLTPVVAVMIPDVAGGLHKVLTALTEAGINLEYMYSSLAGGPDSRACMIFRLADPEKAENILRAKGFSVVDRESVQEI